MKSELIDTLAQVGRSFRMQLAQDVAQSGAGLTSFQARLLNLIGRFPQMSQLQLAARIDSDKAQVTRALKALEARGLIARAAHPTDWRVKCLSLTAQGHQMHQDLNALRQGLEARMLEDFPADERAQLLQMLRRMQSALSNIPGPEQR